MELLFRTLSIRCGDKAKKFEEMIKRAKTAESSSVSQFDAATDIVLLYAYAMKQANVTGDAAKLAADRTAIREHCAPQKILPRSKVRSRSARTAMRSSRSISRRCKVGAGR